jgi:cation transporter-like permease
MNSMQQAFAVVLAVAAAFVGFTSSDLPPVVASHFDGDGIANGFMSKDAYTASMLVFVVALPALIGFSGSLVRVLPTRLINLPHREYWLAPQRKAATLESLSSLTLALAFVLVAFLCFVHWLVVQANAVQPATLAETLLFVALGVLGGVTVAWFVVLYRRFGRVQ